MDLIMLGGYSSRNREWIEEVADSLQGYFGKIEIIYYKHWDTGSEMDFEHELQRLKESALTREEFCIFAKSVGVILALKGIKEGLKPRKCFFAGVPVIWANSNNVDYLGLFENFSIPTIFLQKKNDPAMSFRELEKFLIDKKAESYQLIEWEGDDHHYGDIDELMKLIVGFFAP